MTKIKHRYGPLSQLIESETFNFIKSVSTSVFKGAKRQMIKGSQMLNVQFWNKSVEKWVRESSPNLQMLPVFQSPLE